jgi:hypothetical protein
MIILNDVLQILLVVLQGFAALVVLRWVLQLVMVIGFGFEKKPLSEKSLRRLSGLRNLFLRLVGVRKPVKVEVNED